VQPLARAGTRAASAASPAMPTTATGSRARGDRPPARERERGVTRGGWRRPCGAPASLAPSWRPAGRLMRRGVRCCFGPAAAAARRARGRSRRGGKKRERQGEKQPRRGGRCARSGHATGRERSLDMLRRAAPRRARIRAGRRLRGSSAKARSPRAPPPARAQKVHVSCVGVQFDHWPTLSPSAGPFSNFSLNSPVVLSGGGTPGGHGATSAAARPSGALPGGGAGGRRPPLQQRERRQHAARRTGAGQGVERPHR
jgi:hypothetical protein